MDIDIAIETDGEVICKGIFAPQKVTANKVENGNENNLVSSSMLIWLEYQFNVP